MIDNGDQYEAIAEIYDAWCLEVQEDIGFYVGMALGTETGAKPCTEDWETTNIHALASVLVHHALLREETRGSHWREDFPDRDDQGWRMRLVSRLGEQGQLETRRIGVDANSGSDHD